MKIKNLQYLVGIDLGTTHTVVAYAPISTPQMIQLFPIEQLVDVGQVAARPLLPSVRYHPAEGEIASLLPQVIMPFWVKQRVCLAQKRKAVL